MPRVAAGQNGCVGGRNDRHAKRSQSNSRGEWRVESGMALPRRRRAGPWVLCPRAVYSRMRGSRSCASLFRRRLVFIHPLLQNTNQACFFSEP
jgi:hypothetical protein